MATATFETVPAERQTGSDGAQFPLVAPRPAMEMFPNSARTPSIVSNVDLQLLDPRQHPAVLPERQSSLAVFNVLEPQPRYNNVTLTSYMSLGNQMISLR